MLTFRNACGLWLIWALTGFAQLDRDLPADTNYYVVGVPDWKGNLTVQVLNAPDFEQLKKDTALDNRALNYAYQNLRTDWKIRHRPAPNTENPARTPPFPLKRPQPKNLQIYVKQPTAAAADSLKSVFEAREADRQKRIEEANARTMNLLSDKKRDELEDRAGIETDLLEQFEAEIKDVKMSLEMGLSPLRKDDRNSSETPTSGRKTISVRQGARLGETAGDLVGGGDLVETGELKKKR